MAGHAHTSFDDLPEQIEFHQKLKKQLELGRQKLEKALTRAAKIPIPGDIPKFSEEDRIQEIRAALEKRDATRVQEQTAEALKIRLQETPTFFLFELEPKCYAKGTIDGDRLEAVSDAYREEKIKRSNIDWRRDAFTQTVSAHFYSEHFQTDPILREDKECSASNWILYDDLRGAEINKNDQGSIDEVVPETTNEEDKEMMNEFQKAVQTTCRVLASNTFSKEQITFCHKHLPCQKMSYKMDHLWTLISNNGPVNKISLNTYNPKVLGVGYGDREGPGTLLVWHVKNPECPERTVTTQRAVTGLQFSASQPRLLAAVTRDGSVLLVDTASQPPVLTHVNKDEQPPFPEPLWAVSWYIYSDGICDSERLLTIGQNGQLLLWDPITKKEPKTVAELNLIVSPDPELKLRCQELLGEEPQGDRGEHFMQVPYIGLSIELNPTEATSVYVTTDVGAIIKVSTSRIVEGVGWTKIQSGHKLPVLGLRHSPYQPKVFLTNSSDGVLAIWVHGFRTPLLQLATSDISLFGLESAEWSPSHSSVVASLSREEVCIWDIGRTTDRPVSRISGSGYTTLAFSESGTNLLIGCRDGNVLVYRLSEMPHRPYMQKEHLEKSLKKALENKPDLLKGLNTYLKN